LRGLGRVFAGRTARISRRWWVVAAITVCLVAATLHPVTAQLVPPHRFQLDNGLRVIFQTNQPTHTVVLCAFVRVTALHELRETVGIRQLTQQMLGRAESFE